MNDWSRKLSRATIRLADAFANLGALAVVVLTAVVTLEVISRYAFNSPTMWADEMASYLLLAIVFLGLAHTLRMGGHIRIEILTSLMSVRLRLAAELVTYLIGIAFAVFLIIACYTRLENFWARQTHSYSILYTPLYLPAIPLLVGSVVFLLMMVAGLVGFIFIRDRDAPAPGSEPGKP